MAAIWCSFAIRTSFGDDSVTKRIGFAQNSCEKIATRLNLGGWRWVAAAPAVDEKPLAFIQLIADRKVRAALTESTPIIFWTVKYYPRDSSSFTLNSNLKTGVEVRKVYQDVPTCYIAVDLSGKLSHLEGAQISRQLQTLLKPALLAKTPVKRLPGRTVKVGQSVAAVENTQEVVRQFLKFAQLDCEKWTEFPHGKNARHIDLSRTVDEKLGLTERCSLDIADGVVIRFDRSLKIPVSALEQQAWRERQLTQISSVIWVVIVLVGIMTMVVFFGVLKLRQVKWRVGLSCAAIYFLLSFCISFLTTTSVFHGYKEFPITAQNSWCCFLFAWTGVTSVCLFVLVLVSEFLCRKAFPSHVAWEELVSIKGLFGSRVRQGIIVGTLLLPFFMAYECFFYSFGRDSQTFWSLITVSSFEKASFTTALFGMSRALYAACFEELFFRVICLQIFQKVVRNFWIAALLQALLWGAGHCTLGNQPTWFRLIELIPVGLSFAVLLRYFGIVTCLAFHYAWDSMIMTSLPASEMSGIESRAVILLPFILPILIVVVSWLVQFLSGGERSIELKTNNEIDEAAEDAGRTERNSESRTV